jgi:hypothetical protein
MFPWCNRSRGGRIITIGCCAADKATSLGQATPCSQSQIGQDRHLRRCEVAQVDATSVLSVVVRWRPVKTAVTGTLVARPRG